MSTPNPTTAYINYLLSENCYLQCRFDDLTQLLQSTQSNVTYLNAFIENTYDLSSNQSICSHVVTYDESGNVLACLNSDGNGGFTPCLRDLSDNFLPCVLPPMTRDIEKRKPTKKRGLYDYPYPGYPYYSGYPYYNPYYNVYYNGYYNGYYNPPYDAYYPHY
jgi:hypothetical protein